MSGRSLTHDLPHDSPMLNQLSHRHAVRNGESADDHDSGSGHYDDTVSLYDYDVDNMIMSAMLLPLTLTTMKLKPMLMTTRKYIDNVFFFTPGLLSISGTAPKRMVTSATGKIVAVGLAEVPRTSALPRL